MLITIKREVVEGVVETYEVLKQSDVSESACWDFRPAAMVEAQLAEHKHKR
ncbi:hypothetical protein M7I_2723 [Glarea lozoyensis 74030]|uniref:Uncharacterized protein n=1 Tax=Glarea lozoyensis (strain ATCC 74030 / MF5533) TaxID=1104152 RepID=H0EJJ6_GLAL7|nr:hypothetical protein M7I_2723 [Glarea lozoyensis 74030]